MGRMVNRVLIGVAFDSGWPVALVVAASSFLLTAVAAVMAEEQQQRQREPARGIAQQAESGPGVFDVHEVPEAVNHLDHRGATRMAEVGEAL